MSRNELLELANKFYTKGNATEREIAFARFVMAYEREECAKVAEFNARMNLSSDGIASKIRARGKKQ